MISVSYKVTGADALLQELAGIRLDRIERDLDSIMNAISADAADYPPELPGQRYQRTGRLGRGWTGGQTLFPRSDPTILEAVRANTVDYAGNVMGAGVQGALFVGRWRTEEQIMDEWEDRVAAAVEDAIDRILPQ